MTTTATVTPRVQTDSRRWWVLAVLCLSVLLVVVDNTIVNVALPTISRTLSASTQGLQWIVDAYTLVFAGLLVVGGNIGDRLGRRRVLQAGLVLFAITSVAAALSRTTGELIASRAAMGVAAALIYPATLALLTNAFTNERERATAIGIWSGVSGLAVAIGPVTGGLLLRHFSWSSVFYVNVPTVIVAVVAGMRLLPESRDPNAGRFDPLGALLAVGGIGLLVWTVIEAPLHGWASATTIAGFAGSLAILAAFGWWQVRRPDPMLDVRLFRNPRFSAASGAIALAFFALFGFIFLITQYFQLVRGCDPLRAGVATLPFAIVTGAMSPAAIVLMKRLGHQGGRDRGPAPDERRLPRRRGDGRRRRLLGPDHHRDGPDVRRACPDGQPRDRGDHGRAAAGQGGRGLGGQRHDPRARRHAGRGDRRVGHELGLQQPPGHHAQGPRRRRPPRPRWLSTPWSRACGWPPRCRR